MEKTTLQSFSYGKSLISGKGIERVISRLTFAVNV